MTKSEPPKPMNKYERVIHSMDGDKASVRIDVYSVLEAYNVTCQARGHAIKKLLMAGLRGSKDEVTDLEEAIVAIRRAIALCRSQKPNRKETVQVNP